MPLYRGLFIDIHDILTGLVALVFRGKRDINRREVASGIPLGVIDFKIGLSSCDIPDYFFSAN